MIFTIQFWKFKLYSQWDQWSNFLLWTSHNQIRVIQRFIFYNNCKLLQHFSIRDAIRYLHSTFMTTPWSGKGAMMKLRCVMHPCTVHCKEDYCSVFLKYESEVIHKFINVICYGNRRFYITITEKTFSKTFSDKFQENLNVHMKLM